MFVPVTLNGHRFGWISQQRADGLLTQGIAAVRASGHGISLHVPDVDDGLHEIHRTLAEQGMLQDWRDEWIEVLDWSGVLCMGRMERAAARFWGSHTRAVHLNAWVRTDAEEEALVWVAKRAASKSTDPGLWDNLVAGGLCVDESPLAGLRREALEEAGLDLAWAKQVHIGPTLKIDREVEQGWQRESLHVVDAELPADFSPTNWDGEVQAFQRLDEASTLRLALSGQMTADAALVTLDFLRARA
jgi:8-oxo-dGTP pyrophosphatase MutT (NUDIX family)